nr:hypothetical protein [Tanacetum cinerariifolium]
MLGKGARAHGGVRKVWEWLCKTQSWNTVAIKQVNDVTRLQALVDRKKVVITEAVIREVLRLDDAEGVDCLPNEEIFCRVGSHSLVRNVDSTSRFYMYPRFIQLLIRNKIGKEFSRVKTPLFEGMIVGQVIEEGGAKEETIHTISYSTCSTTATTSRSSINIPEEDKEEEEAKVVEDDQEDEPAEVHKVVDVVTTAKLITEVVTAASETVTTASTIISAAEPQVTAATITAAPIRVAAASTIRRIGVVIRDLEEESTTSSIIPTDTKSKDKGKGIMVEEPKPLKKKQQVEMDEEYARKLYAEPNKDIDWDVAIDHVKQKSKEDPAMQIYQVMKKKPQTEAQSRMNMIMYLKNVAGFRLDYFKGMSYDDIRPIFEAKFNSNIKFLLKTKEQIEEEESRALQSINDITPRVFVSLTSSINSQ